MIEGEEKTYLTAQSPTKKPDSNNKTLLLEKQSQNHSPLDLFRFKSIRSLTIIMIGLWVFRYSTYYGQAFSLASVGSNVNRVMLMIALSEVVACLISGISIKKKKILLILYNLFIYFILGPIKLKLNRITTMAIFATICSLCCILIFFIKRP